MTTWPPGAREILARLDHHLRSRAELMVLAKVGPSDWHEAITFLVVQELAVRTGEKRGTRYTKANGQPVGADFLLGAPGVVTKSPYATDYHDVLAGVLDELGVPSMRVDRLDRIARAAKGKHPQASHEVIKKERGIGNNYADPEDPIHRLIELTEVLDLRDRGGCFWVLDGPGVRPLIRRAEKLHKVSFYLTNRPKATKGRPAWWSSLK